MAGLLAGPDVAPLEVVDVVELEILEGTEIAGLSLLDALEAKEKAALYRSNLRDFLIMEYELMRPSRIGSTLWR
ncbi:hypothetical protein [Pseudonocardia ailaonensis]|uniref:hypothetical protein n=1 Tax=Pseudonocardia ailaonensis TaxID=367279 RepID=UPI0031DB0CB8